MKIRRLKDVLKENPKFPKGWQADKLGGLSNPRFGSIRPIVVCKDDGTPIWDQYEIEEKPGAIVVPYHYGPDGKEIYIGLITCVRAVVADKETGVQGNVKSIEVPRGFGIGTETPFQTAVRELGEETQYVVQDLKLIGEENPNNAFYKNYGITAFSALIKPDCLSKFRSESKERILQCVFHPVEEVVAMAKAGQIFCGLTKAALFDFLAENNLIKF